MTRIDSPLARYARATAPDGWLTADGWMRLAADLDAAARAAAIASLRHRNRGERSANLDGAAQGIRDRAADCRARAAALTRHAI